MIKGLKKLFKPEEHELVDTSKPSCWTLGWSGTIELGFLDGTYLPRQAALVIFPQYFKDEEPILDMLPMDKPKI